MDEIMNFKQNVQLNPKPKYHKSSPHYIVKFEVTFLKFFFFCIGVNESIVME
jgi:hypothetical protein